MAAAVNRLITIACSRQVVYNKTKRGRRDFFETVSC